MIACQFQMSSFVRPDKVFRKVPYRPFRREGGSNSWTQEDIDALKWRFSNVLKFSGAVSFFLFSWSAVNTFIPTIYDPLHRPQTPFLNLTEMHFFSHFGPSALVKLANSDRIDHAVDLMTKKLVIDTDRSSALDVIAALAYRPAILRLFLERLPNVPRCEMLPTITFMDETLPNRGLMYFYPVLELLIEAPTAIINASESQFQTAVQTSLDLISNMPPTEREVPYLFLRALASEGNRLTMWQSNPQFEEYRALMIERLLENEKNACKVLIKELPEIVGSNLEASAAEAARRQLLEEQTEDKERVYDDSFRGRMKKVGNLLKGAVENANEETMKFQEEKSKEQEEAKLMKESRKKAFEIERKRKAAQLAATSGLEKAQTDAEAAQVEFAKHDDDDDIASEDPKAAAIAQAKKDRETLMKMPTARDTEGKGGDMGVVTFLYLNGSLKEPGTWWLPKRIFGSSETHDIRRRAIQSINAAARHDIQIHQEDGNSSSEVAKSLIQVGRSKTVEAIKNFNARANLEDKTVKAASFAKAYALIPPAKRERLSPTLETKTMMRGTEMSLVAAFWLGIAHKIGIVRSIWNMEWIGRAMWGGVGLASRAAFIEMIYRTSDRLLAMDGIVDSKGASTFAGIASNVALTAGMTAVIASDMHYRTAIWFLVARLLVDPTSDSYRLPYKANTNFK